MVTLRCQAGKTRLAGWAGRAWLLSRPVASLLMLESKKGGRGVKGEVTRRGFLSLKIQARQAVVKLKYL